MNVTEPIWAWSRKTPDAPAVLTEDGTLSYAELACAVSWTARTFQEAGMAAGDAVGIELTSQIQYLLSSLALARLGAGQIALPASDPRPVRDSIVRRLRIAAIIADKPDAAEAKFQTIAPPPERLHDIRHLRSPEFQAAEQEDLPFLFVSTSGTTSGALRLGLLTHGLARHCLHPLLIEGTRCRYFSPIKVSFSTAIKNAFRCLMTGGYFTILEKMGDPEASVEFIKDQRVNYYYGTPIHAARLLELAKKNEILLPGIDVFLIATAPLSEVFRRRIQESLTPNLYIHYGTNEAGTISIATPEQVRSLPGVVGKVLPGVQAEIVDDDGQPLPPGRTGNLRVKSAGMISGYIDDPVETAEAFRDGWFYSNDLAEFTPDGELIHHGRADDLMILDGINIYPAEIENVLLRHPAVAEAAAFPIRSVARGDIPIAAVVTKSQASEGELLSHCRSWIGLHAPHGLMIVPKLPRNAVGKILKNELVRLFRRQLGKRQSEHSPDRGNRTRDTG
jgi:acyl-coenzyme A synthetase/AMP-(fatty) acid ligase